MFCWDCRSTIRMDWGMMELCKSVERSWRWGFREIVGMRVLDVGLCSDRCKLYEVVGPFGKCGDRVYKGCENDGEDGWMRKG